MNFVTRGLTWFQEQRIAHTSEVIRLGRDKATAKSLNASVSRSETAIKGEGSKQQSHVHVFIIARSELAAAKINVNHLRNTYIWRGEDQYKIIVDSKKMTEHNDPSHLDVNIYAVQMKNACSTEETC